MPHPGDVLISWLCHRELVKRERISTPAVHLDCQQPEAPMATCAFDALLRQMTQPISSS